MCVTKDCKQVLGYSSTSLSFSFFIGLVILILSSCGETQNSPTATTPTSPEEDYLESTTTITSSADIKPKIDGNIPFVVQLPSPDTLSDTLNRPFFDAFSWQSFIALCWPVKSEGRGVPQSPNDASTFLNMENNTPVVWTSYKNQYDLFGVDNPTPWNSTELSESPAGGLNTNFVYLNSINAKSVIHGEADESFSVPLIDQNKNYALFEIRYNEVQYDFIYEDSLFQQYNRSEYLKAHGDTIAMPTNTKSREGSIMVKAAWKTLTDDDDESRFYYVDEMVYDPVTGKNQKMKLGLVGFHIAQKLDIFPEWIWSSFEHVDNVPGSPKAKKPYSFNNGKDIPSTGDDGYFNKPNGKEINPDKESRVPVQVTRLNKIPTTPEGFSTVDLNALFQDAVKGTWMEYYELVITQWPTDPGNFKQNSKGGIYPQQSGQAFPVNGCANTTMETYFQSQSDAAGSGGNSCMGCHYQANNMDYSWSLFLRSHQ
ncbi:MAG: hypothetical protein P1U56_20655 [Saprospiraceae bacterium]|nr:hypothetical protein [Saprospiraceae bacterium]